MNPFEEKNVRLYRWFTILYNARAYYPVLAVLFVDLGLRLEDYSRLNALWALTILLLEIPSGALADTIGRKKLVVFSAILMVIEMGLLIFAPIHGGWVLILMCVTNRILSGVSEAAASGADQALAYDTLDAKGKASLWEEKVLPVVMRARSAGFVVAMLLGGVLYDSDAVNSLFGFIGIETAFTSAQTMRLPLWMVFIQGVLCLIIALQMQEVGEKKTLEKGALRHAVKLTLETIKWSFTTKKVTIVILGTMLIDAFIRNYATVTSEYYREIELPAWSWGFMGASAGLLGMVTPTFAKWLDKRFSPAMALTVIASIAFVGLLGVGFTIPIYGFLPSIICMTTFGLFGFISDNNLHKLADSSRRATILSVKNMALNLGYGFASLVFAQGVLIANHPEALAEQEQSGFAKVLSIQPWTLLVGILLYFLWSRAGRKPKGLVE